MFSAALIATFWLGTAVTAIVDTTATATAAAAVVYFALFSWTNQHGDNKANKFKP